MNDPVASAPAFPPITLGRLRKTHPSLDLMRVRILHALYKGGRTLLGDAEVMSHVFPRHAHEGESSYKERCGRAFYENVLAQIVNRIVAGLAQDPLRVVPKTQDDSLDEYWDELARDVTPAVETYEESKTLDAFVRDVCCEGLVAGWAWVLVDMPPARAAASELEQRESGALDAYPVVYCADQVTDWYEKGGELRWVRSYSCEYPAEDPSANRDLVVETWTLWTATGWAKYVLACKDGKNLLTNAPPKDEDVIMPGETGTHGFGVVPWVQFDTTDDEEQGMHLGDLLESQARSLFNQQCGEVFLRLRAMFQQLYEFLGKDMGSIDEPVATAQQNPNRARPGQRRAPDIIEVRGQDDDARFVAPNMDGAEITLKSIDAARTSMQRVTGQLALSQDTSGAMLRRSGDSKRQDKVETEIALGVVGKKLLGFARRLVEMIARGRQDDVVPDVAGYARFDVDDADDVLAQATQVEMLSIPSATFKRELALRAVQAVLGDEVPAKVIDAIQKELEAAITQDAIMQAAAPPPMPGEGSKDQEGDDEDDGGEKSPTQVATDNEGKVKVADGSPPPKTSEPLPDEIMRGLRDDYAAEDLSWIDNAKWDGPTRVDLADIDFDNSANWHAADEPDKVSGMADKIAGGWEKPILLVKRPGESKLMIVDGHHRALAYLHHEKSALAYVGTVSTKNGPWDTMHQQQKGGGKSGSKSGAKPQ